MNAVQSLKSPDEIKVDRRSSMSLPFFYSVAEYACKVKSSDKKMLVIDCAGAEIVLPSELLYIYVLQDSAGKLHKFKIKEVNKQSSEVHLESMSGKPPVISGACMFSGPYYDL